MHKGGLYLSIGDSTTWSQTSPGNTLYTSRLWRAICTDYGRIRMLNKGFGGADSSETVANLTWNTMLKPDLVTIGLGLNDAYNTTVSVANFQSNIEKIVDTLRLRNPNVSIVLCTSNQTNDPARTTIQQYRDAMATVATNKNVGICHFENAWTSAQISTYNQADGVHPNPLGHQLLFNLLYPIVQTNASSWINTLNNQL